MCWARCGRGMGGDVREVEGGKLKGRDKVTVGLGCGEVRVIT